MCSPTRRVLVADDEPNIRKIVSLALRNLDGVIIDTVCDGIEALAAFEVNHYDVLVTDLKMPRLGGEELARTVQVLSPSTIILMVSGQAFLPEKYATLRSLAWKLLSKPLDIHTLRSAVQDALLFGESRASSPDSRQPPAPPG